MHIIYPIYFTLGGPGIRWREPRNSTSVTIRYENGDYMNEVSILTASALSGPFIIEDNPVSAYFFRAGEMIRITNIVGYDGDSILKLCPACGEVKVIEEFDYQGRDTGVRRDQSNCMECRGNY